jgi:hypothetical protein
MRRGPAEREGEVRAKARKTFASFDTACNAT